MIKISFLISIAFHNQKTTDNILKTENNECKFNSCSINNINLFIKKNYPKYILNH